MNISELLSAICQRLNHINQKTPEENVIIEYGMTLFLENVSKLLLILAIGFLIGEGKESFIILFTFCMFRLQAGGRHAKNNIGCTLSMLFIRIVIMRQRLTALPPLHMHRTIRTRLYEQKNHNKQFGIYIHICCNDYWRKN